MAWLPPERDLVFCASISSPAKRVRAAGLAAAYAANVGLRQASWGEWCLSRAVRGAGLYENTDEMGKSV